MTTGLPDHEIWLITGHRWPLPDNRMTRYYGLWKRFKGGYRFPEEAFIEESMIASEDGLRFFGAVKCTLEHLDDIHGVMEGGKSSLVILPRAHAEATVRSIVQTGWPVQEGWPDKPPNEILDPACDQSGVVLELYGMFDDPEVSVAAIGRAEVVGMRLTSE